ncbi:MAG: Coenzyme F420 hydrogenase/dehydrogenase, beta subunit C-terminal domain [Lentimicrobium sp.]|jgi:coenzyme F420 hydrogenase subunit beta|nr:Coenzyme F420 hydrogenase/dehydrogenase, beta subunit C-terminal domain [Lentimicrobium sp.]
MSLNIDEFIKNVVNKGTCTGCGLCVGLDESGKSHMRDTARGPRPEVHKNHRIPEIIQQCCAGHEINYPEIYRSFYGKYPENWLTGIISEVFTGFCSDENIRRNSSSGGVLTAVLCSLLESDQIDAAIVVTQGIPEPEKASVAIVNSLTDIQNASQSVYVPVSTLDILNKLNPEKRYAITCLPEQSAALRYLQQNGHKKALSIKYILGPYTGTAIYPAAIETFKKINGVKKNDRIISLKWRAGEWPGYLEIITQSGKVLRSPKVYYNFLIPFFVTNASLQSMDFANEFADLAVGDAWSPEFESQGQGFSVIVSRNETMTNFLEKLKQEGILDLKKEPFESASSMHGHMIDFKKRGSYIRNRTRKMLGMKAPDFGYKPSSIGIKRTLVEIIISTIFIVGRTSLLRSTLYVLPERIIGPLFNTLRLRWKKISRKTKRQGLESYEVIFTKQ